jgi:hypothetical protein
MQPQDTDCKQSWRQQAYNGASTLCEQAGMAQGTTLARRNCSTRLTSPQPSACIRHCPVAEPGASTATIKTTAAGLVTTRTEVCPLCCRVPAETLQQTLVGQFH